MIFSLFMWLACLGIISGQSALTPPYTCTTTICSPGETVGNSPVRSESGTSQIQQGRPGKRGSTGQKGDQGEKGEPCQCDVADEDAMLEMRRRMEKLEAENLELMSTIHKMTPMDCSEVATYYTNVSWIQIYPLKNIGDLTSYTVRCQQDGWIVIQRRMDGSIDFNRNWEKYADGFGDKTGEFWLGLRAMHALTSIKNYTLRVDLRLADGRTKYAEYSTFRVGDEEDGFRLTVFGYTGNAGDQLKPHNGDRFSSKDRDLDTYSTNCAVNYEGAFWYHACYSANLNGKYGSRFYWHGLGQLSFSEMKIRRA